MVDLHTHSNASDGDLSPSSLIHEASQRGLRAIALTDHDTINGLEIARKEAQKKNIQLIPGIEISIDWKGIKAPAGISGTGPGGEFHLLGLGISQPSAGFKAAISDLARRREVRNLEILRKMGEMGIEATWEDVKSLSGGDSIGRLHFARLLIARKIVKNQEQAFSRYLGVGKPLFVHKEGMVFEEATALIRESAGIPVLAHPMSLFVAWGRLPDLIKALKDRGLMGLEAWHPTAKPRSCRRLADLGKSLGLYITEGSDYHGTIRPDRSLGHSSHGRKISDKVLEAIPELNQNLSFKL